MQVTFKGQHLTVPDPIKDHARRRLARLDRYLPLETEVILELRREDTRSAEQRYIAQATVIDGGRILRAEERARDMEQAVDATVDTLSRQASRHKQRLHRHSRASLRGTATDFQTPAIEPDTDDAGAEEGETTYVSGQVVRVKRFAVKPMTVEEAIDQMELLDHNFFLFFSAEENQYGLLYRRADKDYGLILPNAP